MIFRGRAIDPIALFSQWCDFPDKIADEDWSPLVYCPNPSHDNKRTPAFNVNLKRSYVKCYAECGISGSYEHAIAIILDLRREDGSPDVRAARQVVLRGARVASLREVVSNSSRGGKAAPVLTDLQQDIVAFERGDFSYLTRRALDYLQSRGISDESRFRWRIGWDDKLERIVVPAYDERQSLKFLIRRAIDSDRRPKYLYTRGAGKADLLFGACRLDEELVRSFGLILCEGSLDAIKLHQHGMGNAVAILGTGLSQRQARIVEALDPRKVFCLFDRDSAGVVNVVKACQSLPKRNLRVCRYSTRSQVTDPDGMTREEVEDSIERSIPAATFLADPRLRNLKRSLQRR